MALQVSKKKLNFSYKKTRLIPGKIPDEQTQVAFIEKINDLIYDCINSNNEFYFFDPAHQIHNNINGKAWQEKGAKGTVQVKSNTGRRRVNIIGALNALKLEVTSIITEENCNKELVCSFLKELKDANKTAKKIYLVLDNARYNRAYDVQNLAPELDIELIYLPPYSPNLNIIERLWKFFKKEVMKHKYYQEFPDFFEAICLFFKNIKTYEEDLKTLLSLNFQIIKTN